MANTMFYKCYLYLFDITRCKTESRLRCLFCRILLWCLPWEGGVNVLYLGVCLRILKRVKFKIWAPFSYRCMNKMTSTREHEWNKAFNILETLNISHQYKKGTANKKQYFHCKVFLWKSQMVCMRMILREVGHHCD